MPTKIIVPTSVVGTGISVNVPATPAIPINTSVCPSTDITQDLSNALLREVYVFIASNYPPQTIVNYISAVVGSPTIGSNNWCFLNCVSANLFKTATYAKPSTYTYNNPAQTFAQVTNCFPQFLQESGGSGGMASLEDLPYQESLLLMRERQIEDLLNMLQFTIDDIQALLSDLFANFSEVMASFLSRIAMTSEHLAETVAADVSKQIGSSIEWIAKLWKSIKDMLSASTTYATVSGQPKQNATVAIGGFITDILKDAGQYIEQIGELLYDQADKLIDLKEIAFMFRTLGAMTSSFSSTIAWQYGRLNEATSAQSYGNLTNSGLYNTQKLFAVALQASKSSTSGPLASQENCNNSMEQKNHSKMNSLLQIVKTLLADEKAAFKRLKASNAAYAKYVKADIAGILYLIKSIAGKGVPNTSSPCKSQSNQQPLRLETVTKISNISVPGVHTS